MLNDQELWDVLKAGESDRAELTESVKNLDKIRQAVCAFANDLPDHRKPGLIFIGIKDDRSCAKLIIDDKLLQTLGGLRSDGKILPFPTMEVGKRSLNGCEVAVIQVEPSDNPPVKVDGRCWIRVGPRRAQGLCGGRASSDGEKALEKFALRYARSKRRIRGKRPGYAEIRD